MTDDGWRESTEGELDPDLTEEAGYGHWEPPQRRWAPLLMRVTMALVLLAIVGSVLLQALL